MAPEFQINLRILSNITIYHYEVLLGKKNNYRSYKKHENPILGNYFFGLIRFLKNILYKGKIQWIF